MGAVGDAFEMALAAHEGQTDKAGEPYVAHLVRVASRCACDTERAVALTTAASALRAAASL